MSTYSNRLSEVVPILRHETEPLVKPLMSRLVIGPFHFESVDQVQIVSRALGCDFRTWPFPAARLQSRALVASQCSSKCLHEECPLLCGMPPAWQPAALSADAVRIMAAGVVHEGDTKTSTAYPFLRGRGQEGLQ